MSEPSLLVYDLETSGLSPSFDQVMQYAMIRLDHTGQILEKKSDWVKLCPDTIPDPVALCIHQQGVALCEEKGVSYDQVVAYLHQALNQAGTCSGGYNTLGFDDEFLRFAFYRYMYPPYTHQYAQGCYRFDCYPIVVMYALFNPDALIWPMHEGRRSFKLEALNEANQLAPHAQAHHAMGDVEVTVALIQRLQAYPDMWQYMMGYFNKATDQARAQRLPTCFADITMDAYLGLWVEGKLGADAQYQAPVLYLGQHPRYRNQTLWLRLDQSIEDSEDPDAVLASAWIFRKKWGEPGFILPLNSHYTRHWSASRYQTVLQFMQWCQKHHARLISFAAESCETDYPDFVCDADAALYQEGFPSPSHVKEQALFVAAPFAQKLAYVRRWSGSMKARGYRCIWRHAPHLLTHEADQAWCQTWLAARHQPRLDYRQQPNRCRESVMKQIQTSLASSPCEKDRQLLTELQAWLTHSQEAIIEVN